MPIYEYICEKCGAHIEVMQKIADAPLKRCTKCRGKLKKVISRTSFQLKGSGWYKTDYSSKDSPKDAPGADKKDVVSDKKTEGASKITATGETD
jgi:putative FmdB family regulatory protein